MQNKLFLGIDIGGSSYKFGVIDMKNNIIYKKSIYSEFASSVDSALHQISQIIDEMLISYPEIESIGFGFPGVINNGFLVHAPNLNWKNVEVERFFKDKYCLPIAIDNDANAAAVAELLFGNGKNIDNFIYITLGTGVGGAIIINRKIYKGVFGGAGEIGHLIIDVNHFDADVPVNRNGTLEYFVGRHGIIAIAKKLISKHKNSTLISNKFTIKEIDVVDISKAAICGDIAAIECLNLVGQYLGKAIASLASIFDIPDFIIGGGISQSDLLLEVAINTAKERSMSSISKSIIIEKAHYLNDTGIIGAALLGRSICNINK